MEYSQGWKRLSRKRGIRHLELDWLPLFTVGALFGYYWPQTTDLVKQNGSATWSACGRAVAVVRIPAPDRRPTVGNTTRMVKGQDWQRPDIGAILPLKVEGRLPPSAIPNRRDKKAPKETRLT